MGIKRLVPSRLRGNKKNVKAQRHTQGLERSA